MSASCADGRGLIHTLAFGAEYFHCIDANFVFQSNRQHWLAVAMNKRARSEFFGRVLRSDRVEIAVRKNIIYNKEYEKIKLLGKILPCCTLNLIREL